MSAQLIPRQTIESMCLARDSALAKAAQAVALLDESIEDSKGCSKYPGYFLNNSGAFDRFYGKDFRGRNFTEEMRRKLDAHAWERVLDLSGARGLMDATALEAFRDQLKDNPPEFTRENIAATLVGLYEDRELIFRRGLVSAFEAASGKYLVTNRRGGQAIPHRIIMGRVLTQCTGNNVFGFWSCWGRSDQCVNDLDRVFHILDGKPAPTDNLVSWRLDHEAKQKGRGVMIDTEYMRFLPRKNGNLEIQFKRLDLLEKANLIMADEAGNSLRQGKAA